MRGMAALAAALMTCAAASSANAICAADGRVKVAITLAPPAGHDLAGIKIILDYPEDAVAIPGFENQPDVQARVADVPLTFLSAANDTDTELIMSIVGMNVLPAATVFTVDFDRCQGTPAVRPADFRCQVKEASTPSGELIDGSTCSVAMTSDRVVAGSDGGEKTKSKRGNAK